MNCDVQTLVFCLFDSCIIQPSSQHRIVVVTRQMLRFLADRESGCDRHNLLFRAETTRRAYSLQLSKRHDVQSHYKSGVNTLDLDPIEARYMLSGGADGMVVIYDVSQPTGVPQCTFPSVSHVNRTHSQRHKFSVQTVQWYPLDTGMFITSGFDKLLKVWDTNSMTVVDEYEFSGLVNRHQMSSVAVTHGLIAVASRSSNVKLVDMKSGSATHSLKGHRHPVLTLAWSTSKEFILATGGEDNKVMMWDVRSAKGCLMVLDQHNGDPSSGPQSVNTAHNGFVNGLQFMPDGLHLITFGSDNRLRRWDSDTGQNTLVNYGHISNESKKSVQMSTSRNCIPELLFVPDDNQVAVLDAISGNEVSTLRGHYSQVNSCVWDPNYHFLFSAGNDRNILVWIPDSNQDASECYEEHLRGSTIQQNTHFTSRVGAVDTWSSDED